MRSWSLTRRGETRGPAFFPHPPLTDAAEPNSRPELQGVVGAGGAKSRKPGRDGSHGEHILNYPKSLTPAEIDVPTLVLNNAMPRVLNDTSGQLHTSSERHLRAGTPTGSVSNRRRCRRAGSRDSSIRDGAPSGLAPQRTIAAVLFTNLVDRLAELLAKGTSIGAICSTFTTRLCVDVCCTMGSEL